MNLDADTGANPARKKALMKVGTSNFPRKRTLMQIEASNFPSQAKLDRLVYF